MADFVRIEFEPGRTRKLIPKAKHVQAVCVAASARMGRTMTVTDLTNDWGFGWPYLIQALLLEQNPDMTNADACDLMDTYFDTHAGDKDALKTLARGLGRALERYTGVEAKAVAEVKDEAARPTSQPEP
jgi:hypothetical protein